MHYKSIVLESRKEQMWTLKIIFILYWTLYIQFLCHMLENPSLRTPRLSFNQTELYWKFCRNLQTPYAKYQKLSISQQHIRFQYKQFHQKIPNIITTYWVDFVYEDHSTCWNNTFFISTETWIQHRHLNESPCKNPNYSREFNLQPSFCIFILQISYSILLCWWWQNIQQN